MGCVLGKSGLTTLARPPAGDVSRVYRSATKPTACTRTSCTSGHGEYFFDSNVLLSRCCTAVVVPQLSNVGAILIGSKSCTRAS